MKSFIETNEQLQELTKEANGKHFESQLLAASIKLRRAVNSEDNVDSVSGFSEEDIYHFLIGLPLENDEDQQSKVSAVLRQNGYEIN